MSTLNDDHRSVNYNINGLILKTMINITSLDTMFKIKQEKAFYKIKNTVLKILPI